MKRSIFALCFWILVAVGSSQDAAKFRQCLSTSASGVILYSPGDAGYANASTLGLYPSPAPLQVVQVTQVEQVAAVVSCASTSGYQVCTRSGGHDFVGRSSCRGVQIDTHLLKNIQYDDTEKTVTFEPGNTLGELLYGIFSASKGTQMLGIGLCPSVGVAGYILGGGHNPYSGLLGLTCDSLVALKMVNAQGKTIVVDSSNPQLLWASCGGGGGHFGIVTEFTMKTHDAKVFNRNVFFRYQWPIANAGAVIYRWMDYDQDLGKTWFRLEVNKGDKIYGYGVCWDVDSLGACEARFQNQSFFNVPSREKVLMVQGKDVLAFQKFIGPFGNWAWNTGDNYTNEEALVGTNFLESRLGFNRLYSSRYLKVASSEVALSESEWQSVATDCASAGDTVQWLLCQFNPWKGKNKQMGDSAFAHREADVFMELIGGNDSAPNPEYPMKELLRVEEAVGSAVKRLVTGIFNNYPEFRLAQEDYMFLYYGQSANQLSVLRESVDPESVFTHFQEIPFGIPCPAPQFSGLMLTETGSLSGSEVGVSLRGSVMGNYSQQYAGMNITIQFSSVDCQVTETAPIGATIEEREVLFNGALISVYDIRTLDSSPFELYLSKPKSSKSDVCLPSIIGVNGIACNGIRALSSSGSPGSSASPTVTSTSAGPTSTSTSTSSPGATASPSSSTPKPSAGGSATPTPTPSSSTPKPAASGSATPTPTSGSGSESACFPASATVQLKNGSKIPMEQLELGDWVQTGEETYSPVILFTHRLSTGNHEFVRLEIQSSISEILILELSASHFLFVDGQLQSTGNVKIGDLVELVGEHVQGTVSRLSKVGNRGLFNPHTLDGMIVVNGVLASCYTRAVFPMVAHSLLAPLRALYRIGSVMPPIGSNGFEIFAFHQDIRSPAFV